MPINQKGGVILIIGVLALLAAVAAAAYYAGTQQNKLQTQTFQQISQPTAQIQSSSYQKQNDQLTEFTKNKLLNTSFKSYSIKYPASWTKDVKKEGEAIETLTLSKNNYAIKIVQAGMGGGGCIFEGVIPEGPYVDYRNTPYKEIETNVGVLRRIPKRSNETNMTEFEFCASTDKKSYQTPTQVGAIAYSVPSDYDPILLKEMDNIIATLKEVPDNN
jgi:type II secretory pathway pseudopilin PulG